MRAHPSLQKVVDDLRDVAREVAESPKHKFFLALLTDAESKKPAIEESSVWVGRLGGDVRTVRPNVVAFPESEQREDVASIAKFVDNYCQNIAQAGALLPYSMKVGWEPESDDECLSFLRFFYERHYLKNRSLSQSNAIVLSVTPPIEAADLLEREFLWDSITQDGGYLCAEDFRTVCCGSHSFEFTPKQSSVVAALFDASRVGTKSLSNQSLLSACASDQRQIARIFRGNPAWGILIVPAPGQGMYRLADPTELSAGASGSATPTKSSMR